MAFVEFRDVRKVYAMGEVEVAAVDGMTFDVERGEFVVVVGPSGAGKTTLLNMLGGMDVPTSGSILLDGRDVSAFSAKELTYYRRYDIGFVFQFYNLVQNLTALENVELASQICKDPLPADDVLRQVGLGHRLDNFPAQLSGGEQQRVAIARAMLKDSPVVILDEATAFADPDNEAKVQAAFHALAKNKTVLMIAHRLSTVMNADCIFVVQNGAIVERGTSRALLEQEGVFAKMWRDYQASVQWKVEVSR